MDASSVKAKGRRAERLVAAQLAVTLPPTWTVVRERLKGSDDEGDIQVFPPPGTPGGSRCIEVKYRTGSIGPMALSGFREQAWRESLNHGADRALLVVNRPASPVPQWTAHMSVDGQMWLMAEAFRLHQMVMIDSTLIRGFENDLQTAAAAFH